LLISITIVIRPADPMRHSRYLPKPWQATLLPAKADEHQKTTKDIMSNRRMLSSDNAASAHYRAGT
jgi:hypothetical protein